MTGIERRAVRRFRRGQCPETPHRFCGRRGPKRPPSAKAQSKAA